MSNRVAITEASQRIGELVVFQGWVQARRDHGKLIFIELRDRTGHVQVVFNPKDSEALHQKATQLRDEWVVEIQGEVIERPESMRQSDSSSGAVELRPKSLIVLSQAQTPPFEVVGDGYNIGEEHRLNYRYLDLRRPRMRKNIRQRHKVTTAIRNHLNNFEFTEIETPILTKATLEGSRDFVVPSRLQPGKFYALPQSPQQYKQLLMVAGFERYYQIARAIRDEDPRADRGFEHTQVDLEMSFVTRDEVMNFVEEMIKSLVAHIGGKTLTADPFPVLTYREAMTKFGADKFDAREDKANPNELAFAWVVDFPFFKTVDKGDVAEVRDGKSGWTFTHNPFSQPKEEFIDQHLKGDNIGAILTSQYDLVCNGFEVGGGSIRASDPKILRATYKIMGYDSEEIEASIGHMLKAFEFGTPPHGGIALGLDRLAMILAGEESMKEVVAFPMSGTGRTAVMDGPSKISPEQLDELGIALVSTEEDENA
ncbi:MAG: hypothetical protein COV31_00830 [Candidatus Yanofskybacteria bacterium CG10_big_fil_rev_8_21_14_0_10_46_23]|uniref:Aminoacyl-transfer RNA synthetases class-II family profile domain-containing protein n=1 Tax=Candidatus Yanofskybacteria bacterium CG10_big_fil_rev_8_21_14_0_10_46_23 TaxID=1975098 RepID=A0A2H0R4E9_9BACT|nr:MAG: hypothetical protein COV31_00830 [Candidatus Yanofskybacteria bacterium CG10_big_fil_rev_8_21_14_0_10_46_23]